MSYYSNSNFDEDDRRNNAFQFLNSLREAVSIAKRTQQPIPYQKTLEIVKQANPDLAKDISALLTKRNESEEVRYYKQKAALESNISIKQVSPEQLIKNDISDHKRLLKLGDQDDLIKKKIWALNAALEYFEETDISENSILNHDFNLPIREKFFGKPLYANEKVKDFWLDKKRVLRLRFLHPDKAEHILGTDLIYEQFDLKKRKVRFAHLQYKTWDEKKVIYFSSGNIGDQIDKMTINLCKSGLCDADDLTNSVFYRFPHCSAFLRPTSKVYRPDSTMVSSGQHVPICEVIKIKNSENKLTKENISDKSVSFNIFEELFIDGFLGSRWITIDQLEQFYSAKNITADVNRIRVHAQEFEYVSEAEYDEPPI